MFEINKNRTLKSFEKILEVRNLYRSFSQGKNIFHVLNGLSFSVFSGEKLAIVGTSGSGKSTLLHLLSGLDKADKGTIHILGEELGSLSDNESSALRSRWIGFVYQFHHLLPEFSALENVSMPLLIRRESIHVAHKKAKEVLKKVGLERKVNYRPSILSGGERQRVAIARALVIEPIFILADEPTGNLDSQNANSICDLISELCVITGVSFLVATHDPILASRCDRVLRLNDGKLE